MSKNSITLDNFLDWHGEVNGVEVRSYLPLPEYVPTQDIYINLGRIATLAKVGRLKSVKLGLYEEEQELSYSIGSVDQSGTATAAAIKAGTISRSSSSINRNNENPLQFPRGGGIIKVNTNHPDMDDQVLRRPQPWAEILDKGFRDGLRNAGKKQLLEPKLERRVGFAVGKIFDSFFAGSMAWWTKSPDIVPLVYGISMMDDAAGLTQRLTNKILRKPLDDYEHTLLRRLPMDRFLIVSALASTQKLVTSK